MDLEIIKQSNKLTQARYEMSSMEQNILFFITAAMKKANYKELYYSVPVDYMLSKLDGDVRLSHLKEAAEKLLKRTMTIEDGNGNWLVASFISSAEINNLFGFEVGIDKKVLPLYQQLNEYTTFELQTALDLKSKYAKRLYVLLNQFKNGKGDGKPYYKVELTELKKILGLIDPKTGKEKFAQWSSFKKDVLDRAQKELATTGDIHFDYRVLDKIGKKVHALYFDIYRDKSKYLRDMPVNENHQALLVGKYGLSILQAQEILRQLDYDRDIQPVLKEIHQKYHNREISNIGGYTAGFFNKRFDLGWKMKSEVQPNLGI